MKSIFLFRGTALAVPLAIALSIGHANASTDTSGTQSSANPAEDSRSYTLGVVTRPGTKTRLMEHPKLIRRAQLVVPAEYQLTEQDAPFAKLLANPKPEYFYISVKLTVSSEGKVAACTLEKNYDAPEFVNAELCGLLAQRLSFLPALNKAGNFSSDSVLFALRGSEEFGNPKPAIRKGYETSNAAERRIVNFRDRRSWPPTGSGGIFNGFDYDQPGVKQGVKDYSAFARKRVSGVYLYSRGRDEEGNARIGCGIAVESGDKPFDEKACELALKKMKAVAGKLNNRLTYPLLVAGKDAPRQVIAPVKGLASKPVLNDDDRARFKAGFLPAFQAAGGNAKRVKLGLHVDSNGSVADCRIFNTSGTTKADLLACESARSNLLFQPALDIFGRPMEYTVSWWSLP